jgi:glutathione peroxidase
MKTVYDYTVKDRQGNDISLSEYRGKVLLIVNTATGCGFTPHYEPLEAMYKELKDKGFEILDFPCNQFADQAPGTDEEIHTFCTGRFGITFPQFAKCDVNGENAIPLYRHLTSSTSFDGFSGPAGLMLSGIVKKMDKDYKNNGNIKWNFTKFLIDREGNIVERIEPTTSMEKVKAKVEAVL